MPNNWRLLLASILHSANRASGEGAVHSPRLATPISAAHYSCRPWWPSSTTPSYAHFVVAWSRTENPELRPTAPPCASCFTLLLAGSKMIGFLTRTPAANVVAL